jgi:hypothetical protein
VAFSVCKALEYLRSKHVIGRKFGDGKIWGQNIWRFNVMII